MSAKLIIQIVPALRPQNDGAGEYGLNLALELRESYGIQSRFIVCDPKWNGPGRIEDFVVQRLRIRNEAGIWSVLSSTKEECPPVLLHYCAYGYQKQGVPFWLYQGIKSWLRELNSLEAGSNKQLLTVFYETLQSSFKPWKKSSYLRIPQRWLIQEFHRRSRLSVTGSRRLQVLLDAVEPHKTLRVPMPENAQLWDANNPDWKLIASQFQAELFPGFSSSNGTARPVETPVKNVQGRKLPKYVLGDHVVEPPVGIRHRRL
jgi:hypothetical protein